MPAVSGQLPRDVGALKQAENDQADSGKMLEPQQRLFAEPAVAARHTKTQEQEPGVRAERDAADAGRLGGERITVHPFARHQVGGEDDPEEQHAQVAEHAHKTGHEGRVRMKFLLDANLPRSAADWLRNQGHLVEESMRPGQYMPIEEDEHGTYILNSKDLRAIEHVQRLVDIGVNSLKIEGRTKSAYYVARTCQSYRQGIDDAVAGRPLDPALLSNLEGLANRGYTGGFYDRHPDQDYQNYLKGHSESSRSQYVGNVLGYDADGMARVEVKNKFSVGDRLEIIHPSGNQELVLNSLVGRDGAPATVAPGSGHEVRIPLPTGLERAFLARYV